MFKFVIALILLASMKTLAADHSAASEILLKEAKQNDVQMVRVKKYMAVINDVSQAEEDQKGKSILNDENIVAIFRKYAKSEMQFNILNGILTEYAKTVRSGKAADEQTLYFAAENYKKAKYPFVSKTIFFAYYEEVIPLLRIGTNPDSRLVANSKAS